MLCEEDVVIEQSQLLRSQPQVPIETLDFNGNQDEYSGGNSGESSGARGQGRRRGTPERGAIGLGSPRSGRGGEVSREAMEVTYGVRFEFLEKERMEGVLRIDDNHVHLSWWEVSDDPSGGRSYFLDFLGVVWDPPLWRGRTEAGYEVRMANVGNRHRELYDHLEEAGHLRTLDAFETQVPTSGAPPASKTPRLDLGVPRGEGLEHGEGPSSQSSSRPGDLSGLVWLSGLAEKTLKGLPKTPNLPVKHDGERPKYPPATNLLLPQGWAYSHSQSKFII